MYSISAFNDFTPAVRVIARHAHSTKWDQYI